MSCGLHETVIRFYFIVPYQVETQFPLKEEKSKGKYFLSFLLQGHTQAVRCLRFSPDGKWLASAADDHTVKVIYYDISLVCLWHIGIL